MKAYADVVSGGLERRTRGERSVSLPRLDQTHPSHRPPPLSFFSPLGYRSEIKLNFHHGVIYQQFEAHCAASITKTRP